MKQDRLFGMVLAVLLLVSASIWAGAEKEASTGTEVLAISWIGGNGNDIQEGNWVQKKIEEKFNVKLVNKVGTVTDKEFRNLMISTGDMPDCGFMYLHETMDIVRAYKEGLVRTIPKEYIMKYMPNYTKLLDKYPLGWLMHLAPDKKDEYMVLTGLSPNLEMQIINTCQRLDWIENAGISLSGKKLLQLDDAGRFFYTKDSFSIDELDTLFRAFALGDPDGNGKKDTYGIGGNRQYFTHSFGPLTGAYGFANGDLAMSGYDYNAMVDGRLLQWNILPGYKELLKRLADWYAKGYVDPEFPTITLQTQWEKVTSGVLGWWMSPFNYADPSSPNLLNRPPLSVIQSNPKTKVLMSPPPSGAGGRRGVRQWAPVGPLNYTFNIKSGVSDEKLARILQIVDYINLDKEASIWSRHGEIGLHSDWSGEPYKSVPKLRQGVKGGDGTGIGYYNHSVFDDVYAEYYTYGPWPTRMVKEFIGTPEGRALNLRPYKYDYFNQTNVNEVRKKYGGDLETIKDEFMYKGITGEIDIDVEWDAYVQRWLRAGGQELLDEYTKAPIVEELRKGKVVY